jgi:hypothetical protein
MKPHCPLYKTPVGVSDTGSACGIDALPILAALSCAESPCPLSPSRSYCQKSFDPCFDADNRFFAQSIDKSSDQFERPRLLGTRSVCRCTLIAT